MEMLAVQLRLPRGYSKVILICVYNPEFSKQGREAAAWQIWKALRRNNSKKPLIYAAGDFNKSELRTIKSTSNSGTFTTCTQERIEL